MKNIKAGILGLGFIGKQHLEAIRRIPFTEIVAVCDPNEAVAKEISEKYDVPTYFTDLDEMLESTDLDVIHNCTPSGLHFETSKKIIAKGVNVYCEKPFTTTSKQSEELVQLVESTDLKGGVNFNYRNNLMAIEMKERINTTEVGRPWFVNAEYLQDWLLRENDFDWRIDSQLGGETRAVSDIGSHCFDTLQYILGEKIVAVKADFFKKFESRKNDGKDIPVQNEDAAIILLEFESGINGLVRLSQVIAGKKNDLHITIEGNEQTLEWNQEQPDRLKIGNRDYPNEEIYADAKVLTGRASQLATLPNGHPVGWADAFKQSLLNFYEDLQGNGNGNYVSFKDADYLMKIIDACVLSNKEKRKVFVKENKK